MTRPWSLFMAVTLGLAFAGNTAYRLLAPPPRLGEERYLAYLFPDAEEIGPKQGTPPHYRAWRRLPEGRALVGIAYLTTDVLPGERGYAGPIHILVGQKPDGSIAAIRVVNHQETPSYAGIIDKPLYWEKFSGKKPADPFITDRDVDSISRATITATAVARSVRDASRIMGRGVLGLDVPPPALGSRRVSWVRAGCVALAVTAALCAWLVPNQVLRSAVLLANTAILGFWLGTYLSLGQIAGLLTGRGSPVEAHLDWYLLLAASILLAMLAGNIFCGWICPFGALQELLGKAARRLGIRTWSGAPAQPATVMRWFYLWLTLMAALALGIIDAVNYEPFGTIFDRKGSLLNWAFLCATLGGSLVVFRFWCRFFCPVGVIMQLLSAGRICRRPTFSLQRDVLSETAEASAPAFPAEGPDRPPGSANELDGAQNSG